MFNLELTEEEKKLADERQAQEKAEEMAREEIRRRQWCMETACGSHEVNKDNVIAFAEKLYDWVYGRKQ